MRRRIQVTFYRLNYIRKSFFYLLGNESIWHSLWVTWHWAAFYLSVRHLDDDMIASYIQANGCNLRTKEWIMLIGGMCNFHVTHICIAQPTLSPSRPCHPNLHLILTYWWIFMPFTTQPYMQPHTLNIWIDSGNLFKHHNFMSGFPCRQRLFIIHVAVVAN